MQPSQAPVELLAQHLLDPIRFARDLPALTAAQSAVENELRGWIEAGALGVNRLRMLRGRLLLSATARLRHIPLIAAA